MASGTSVGKTRGTRSTDCDLLLAWASLVWCAFQALGVSLQNLTCPCVQPQQISEIPSQNHWSNPAILLFCPSLPQPWLLFYIFHSDPTPWCQVLLDSPLGMLSRSVGSSTHQFVPVKAALRCGQTSTERSENAKGKKHLSKKHLRFHIQLWTKTCHANKKKIGNPEGSYFSASFLF